MKRLSSYILSTLIVCLAFGWISSCSNDIFDDLFADGDLQFSERGYLLLPVGMEIPGMTRASTRARLAEDPDYDNLKLYLLVFQPTGLTQFERLETEPYKPDNQHGHQNLVEITSTIELQPTEQSAVVHLIATNQPDFDRTVQYGLEERVINALFTDNQYEAYWQRLDLESNIPSKEMTDPSDERYDPREQAKAENIRSKFRHIPMIRNFCRVSANSRAVSDHFLLTGLYVVNTVDRGSVAPYVASNPAGSRYVEYYDPATLEGLDYQMISAQNHIGTMPQNVQLINNTADPGAITSKSESETGDIEPVYMYERPARVNSTDRTYVILRGRYNGGKDTYYKVDLGNVAPSELGIEIGLFEYYNLIRNFDFVINIRKVESPGYSTFEEAANGTIFNNFSAAVEARSMKIMSDGEDILYLNRNSFVFVRKDEKLNLLAQYFADILNTSTPGVNNNDRIKILVEPGPVITSLVQVQDWIDEEGIWNNYEVTGTTPTEDLLEQTVYVYIGNKGTAEDPDYGLYRAVKFYSHLPWPFWHIQTFPGIIRSYQDLRNKGYDWDSEIDIDPDVERDLTLMIELPTGLPQALFPLTFIIESDRQNIQNAYEGEAVVQSVQASQSLFSDRVDDLGNSLITTSRIQYKKIVTWEEYNMESLPEQQAQGSNIVVCWFNTITDLGQDIIGGSADSKVTTLRVKCDYFGKKEGDDWRMYHEDTFTRTK